MKKKKNLVASILFFFLVSSTYSQSLNCDIETRIKNISEANSSLLDELKAENIEARFPHVYKKILSYEHQVIKHLSRSKRVGDIQRKMRHSSLSIRSYNKARVLLNTLIVPLN